MPPKRRYTDEQFIEAVKVSKSWAAVLRKLGLRTGGGTQLIMRQLAKKLNLNISHMTGQGWNEGTRTVKVTPLSEILIRNSRYGSTNFLKKRLIAEGMKEAICEICHNTEWMGKPIPIQLDHINGNRADNRIENLRIVCPNCHAQTDTYCGKNIGKYADIAQ